jgi:hypothetical protein
MSCRQVPVDCCVRTRARNIEKRLAWSYEAGFGATEWAGDDVADPVRPGNNPPDIPHIAAQALAEEYIYCFVADLVSTSHDGHD